MKRKLFPQGEKWKVARFLLLLVFFSGSICMPATVCAQNGGQLITLNLKQATIEEAIREITQTTRYRFSYVKEDLPTKPLRNYKFQKAKLQEVMDDLLKGTKLQWTLRNGVVIISKTKLQADPKAQELEKVKGQVLDVDKQPFPGVTVLVVGEMRGTTTDEKGNFTLAYVPQGTPIEFRCIGFETKRAPAQKDMGVITLEESVYALEEAKVVSNGLFTRPVENFTGAANSYSGEELRRINPTSILSALKVLDASFQMPDDNVHGSDPNVLPKVQLRGTNSIMQTDMKSEYGYISNPPLIIIDGFESDLETLFDMSPNMIKQVTLLKDAAATAIYGSKSANGVLVVETVQPEEGNVQTFYTGSYGLNIPDLTSFNLMNAREKLEVEELGGYYRSRDYTEQKRLNDLYNLVRHNVERGVNTYWLSQPLRTVFTHTHNLRVTYGTKRVTLQAMLNYARNGGVMKGSYRDALSGSVQAKYTTKDRKLSIQGTMDISTTKGINSPYGDFSQYSRLNPYWMPKDVNGNITKYVDIYPTEGSNGLIAGAHTPKVINPLYNTTLKLVDKSTGLTLNPKFWTEWEFVKDLKFSGTFNYTFSTSGSDVFLPGSASQFFTVGDFSKRGSYSKSRSESRQWQLNTTLNFGKIMGKHTLYVSAGMQMNQSMDNSLRISVQGFPNDRLDDILFGLNYNGTKPTGSFNQRRTVGFFGNASYAFDNRYLLDISYRTDGSSVFGRKKRFGDLGAIGIGWNLHHEKFMTYLPAFSQLKLRASYGFTGSVNFPSYAGTTTYEYQTTGRYLSFIPAQLMGLGNDELVWQRTKKLNTGADISLFKNRITLAFNYYREITDDLIMSTATAPSNGFSQYHANLGKSQNVGYDMSIRLVLLQQPKRQLYWSIATSYYHNENKLLEITDNLRAQNQAALNQQIAEGATSPVLQYQEGSSVSGLYAVRSLGIDASNGYEIFLTKDGKQTYVWRQEDMVYMGDMQPKLNLTLNNNFQYKWLRLNFGLTFRIGGVLYNSTQAKKIENFDLTQNMDRRALKDRWKEPGVPADYKGLTDLEGYTRTADPTRVTSRFVQKANSFEITGITLDPGILIERWLNRLVSQAQQKINEKANETIKNDRFNVRFTMNNVFRLTSLKREAGTAYPFNRSFLLTLTVRL